MPCANTPAARSRRVGAAERSGAIAKTLLSFQPSNEAEKIVHAKTLRQSSHRIELSRARMSNVSLGLPPVLWWVVVMNIVLIRMQDMEIHVHLILGAVLAAILGAVTVTGVHWYCSRKVFLAGSPSSCPFILKRYPLNPRALLVRCSRNPYPFLKASTKWWRLLTSSLGCRHHAQN